MSGGINPYGVPLDALAAPSDVTTLNATTSAHGLLPKLSGSTSQYLRGDGSWAGISVSPGGSSSQIQYNDGAGSFAGAAGLAWVPGSSPNFTVTAQNASHIAEIVKAAASQSADIWQVQKSDGTVYAAINATPQLIVGIPASGTIKLYQTLSGLVSNVESSAYLYHIASSGSAHRSFIGSTQYSDLSTSGFIVGGGAVGVASNATSSAINFIKRNATDPIATNDSSVTTPLWITSIAGFNGINTGARHAYDINFSLGGGGNAASGTTTGGDAASLNVRLRSGGSGTGGGAAGADGAFKIWDGTTQFFKVTMGGKIGFYTATPVTQQVLATGAGKTVDDVITFLQTIGLCKQS